VGEQRVVGFPRFSGDEEPVPFACDAVEREGESSVATISAAIPSAVKNRSGS
jgi:hypothetical protein